MHVQNATSAISPVFCKTSQQYSSPMTDLGVVVAATLAYKYGGPPGKFAAVLSLITKIGQRLQEVVVPVTVCTCLQDTFNDKGQKINSELVECSKEVFWGH